jgi:O-antigen/teichoic acid export membrane protein
MRNARFIAYFLSGALPRLAMLVILFALARLMPLAEAGLFVLVTAVGEVIEMSLGAWLRIFVLHREAGRATLRPYRAGRMLALAAGLTLAAALFAVPVGYFMTPARAAEFCLAAVVYVFCFAILRYVLTLLQFPGEHVRFAAVEIGRGLLMVPLVIAAALASPASFLGPALMLSVSALLAAIAGFLIALPHLTKPRFSRAGLGSARRFGAPIVADTALSLAIIYLDRFVLNILLGPAAVAIYALAYALGRQPIEFLAGPLNNLALPHLFAVWSREGDEGAREVQTGLSITLFILCAAVFVGVTLLREPVVRVLLKPEYWGEAAPLLPFVALSGCLLAFKAFIYDNVFHMLRNNERKIATVIATLAASLVVTLLLVRSFGLNGAVAALVFSSALGLGASFVVSRRYFIFETPLYRFAGVALAAAVAGAALEGAARLAAPQGDLAAIAAGTIAFCLVYAVGLTLQGVSLAAVVSTPWAPMSSARKVGS